VTMGSGNYSLLNTLLINILLIVCFFPTTSPTE